MGKVAKNRKRHSATVDVGAPEETLLSLLVDVLETEDLFLLLRCWGGLRLHVPPASESASNPIRRAIGVRAADAMTERFGGQVLTLPTLLDVHWEFAAQLAAWGVQLPSGVCGNCIAAVFGAVLESRSAPDACRDYPAG